MRRIVAAEMVVVYFSLLLLPYALWRWRRSAPMWILLLFCMGMLLIYAIAAPNVGTLVRFRYPYLMPIVGLGVAGGMALLDRAPDFFIVMGHGLAHPRRFGLACYLGVFADSPTIGCAGTPLTGTSVAPAREAGAWSLVEDGEVIGAVLRTREGTRPVHVSVGHKLDLESAVGLTLACCAGYRMPEPLREARRAARAGHSGA